MKRKDIEERRRRLTEYTGLASIITSNQQFEHSSLVKTLDPTIFESNISLNPCRSCSSKPKTMSLFVIQASPGKGLGLFASAEIPAGTRKLFEQPILTNDGCSAIRIHHKVLNLNAIRPLLMDEFLGLGHIGDLPTEDERQIPAQGALPRKTRMDVFTKVITDAKWSERDDQGRQVRILETRDIKQAAIHYAIFDNKSVSIRNLMNTADIRGVFLNASRINHSCYPNCCLSWNIARSRLSVHALRDIQAGEELVSMYNERKMILGYRDSRMRELKVNFGFDCTGPACDISTDSGKHASRREAMAELMEQVRERIKISGKQGTGVDVTYEKILSLMEDDKLEPLEKCFMYKPFRVQFSQIKTPLMHRPRHIDLANIYELSRAYQAAVDHLYQAKAIAVKSLGEDNDATKAVEALLNRMVLKN